ncbi:MAG TPA: efflux RND transporter periplasmic adaptor subunit [Candidatus Ratteibacteria bacterium]|nr:efflux RND transporter periplasmic adaptor subunit [Candidatus Ratteibacteria bacterium]
MKKKILLICILILFVIGLGNAIVKNIKKRRGNEVKEEVVKIPVKIMQVKRGDVREVVSASGDIQPWSQVTVFSKVTGQVEKLFVDKGYYVKKGGLIAQVDYRNNALAVKQIENQLSAARINYENLKKDYERMKDLFNQKVISEKKLDDTRTACESAYHEVESLEAQLELAKIKLGDTRITSPINGVVAEKFIDEGEIITEASMSKSAPIVTIVDIDTVKIVVNVGEKKISKVKKGQSVEVKVDAYPDKLFIGKVYNISPITDPQTRTTEVEISVKNQNYLLKPGMFARTNIIITSHKNVIVIPFDAIVEREGKKCVFVVEGNYAKMKEITTGLQEVDKIEVTSGLTENENLIIEGQNTVKDGIEVMLVE